MSFWKTKVLPKIKNYFDKPGKKAAAAEACKSFEDSKESIEKELEEKKEELQPKIVEVYKTLDAQTKAIVKQPTDAAIKKHASAVKKFLEELKKKGFPGAAPASEAAAKYGPALVMGPVIYVFQKTSMFIIDVVEEAPPAAEVAPEPKAEVAAVEAKEAAEVAAEPKPKEAAEVAAEPKPKEAAEESTAEKGVFTENVENVEETIADDGKIVETVEVTETVEVPKPEPAKA